MRFYVVGPLSAPTFEEEQANVERAIHVGAALMERGHRVTIPHLSWFVDRVRVRDRHKPFPYERWMEHDLALLSDHDAIFFIGPSPGANRELYAALAEGIAVYHDMGDVPYGPSIVEAVRAFDAEELSEGQLAKRLGVDRLDARRIVQEVRARRLVQAGYILTRVYSPAPDLRGIELDGFFLERGPQAGLLLDTPSAWLNVEACAL